MDCRRPKSIPWEKEEVDIEETNLHNQHKNKDKNEGSIEVRHVESGPKTSNQSVTTNNGSKQHSSKFRAEICYQAVQDSCASNGEGHHHDQVGEEGKGAEDQVGPGSEAGFDHLVEVQWVGE